MPDHSYIETPQQQRERRERQAGASGPTVVDPGAPRTDELARNAALHDIANHIEGEDSEADGQYCANRLLDDMVASVTWETDVSSAGVPVRRYVLRGGWEVDPLGPRTVPTEPKPNVLDELRAWLATYPPFPFDVSRDPEAMIVVRLREMLGISAPYTGEKWDQPICCGSHDDAGEAEPCCEYCPNRLPLRIV